MLATFLIEIGFAVYVLWRYRMTVVTRLVTSILIFLAAFQGTEFLLCGGMDVNGGTWSRIGYSSITMLPPLGLHLAYVIAGKKSRYLVPLAYLTAGAFITYFLAGVNAISGHTCYANYAVFNTESGATWAYALYYYGWLVIGTLTAASFANRAKNGIRQALFALALGYVAFIVPTTAFNLIDPSTIAGIPSIMCGFAVILSFILTLKVAPESIKPQDAKRSLWLKLPF
jgi:hypothetical protein